MTVPAVIVLTSHRVDLKRWRGGCPHCLRSDFHREGCIVALNLDRDAADAARESAAVRQQNGGGTRFVNIGKRVMVADHCAAVASSNTMARTIAVALNNRRDDRDRVGPRERFMDDWQRGAVTLWGWTYEQVKAALRGYQARGNKE